jgi:uncharacterized membrane protein YeaQ/YmgE (transglycosylase-associated protein family)
MPLGPAALSACDKDTTGVRGVQSEPGPRVVAAREHVGGRKPEMMGTIFAALVAGAIVGPLARLVLPGRQDLGVGMTVVLGAIGSLIGALIYYKSTGVRDTSGVDWVSGLIGVVVAAALIVGYGMITAGNRQTR